MGSTESIAWEEEWSIGDELIDSQHKELVKLINELIYDCANDQMNAGIPAALSFLVQYVVTHFSDEEALQLRCNFPYYKEHKKMHEDLKKNVAKLAKKYTKVGSTLSLKKDIYDVLGIWLVRHIAQEDKKIADYTTNA